MAVQEQLDSVPAGFSKEGPADPNAMIDFHVALVPKDIAGLEKTLYAVSTPGSSSYGQYLSLDQVFKESRLLLVPYFDIGQNIYFANGGDSLRCDGMAESKWYHRDQVLWSIR